MLSAEQVESVKNARKDWESKVMPAWDVTQHGGPADPLVQARHAWAGDHGSTLLNTAEYAIEEAQRLAAKVRSLGGDPHP